MMSLPWVYGRGRLTCMQAPLWTALANTELFVDSKLDRETFTTLDRAWILDEDPASWLEVKFLRSLLCLCYDG